MTELKHSERKHALLSASKAHQWLACPPSIREIERLGIVSEGTEASALGTTAHEMAEDMIREWMETGTYNEKLHSTENLDAYVLAVPYVNRIINVFSSVYETDPSATLDIERRVDFSDIVPEGDGIVDCIMVYGNTLRIHDLKTGMVPVNSNDSEWKINPQLGLYAYGALRMYDGFLYDIREIIIEIDQTSKNRFTARKISKEELLAWGQMVKPIAEKAFRGEGKYNPGEKQCRYCPLAGRCRALAGEIEEDLADIDPADESIPVTMSDQEIIEACKKFTMMETYLKNARNYLQNRLMRGEHIDGVTLVQSKGTRTIVDAKGAVEALTGNGYDIQKIMKPSELKSLTELTKIVGGKKKIEAILGDAIGIRPGVSHLEFVQSESEGELEEC